MSDFFAVFCPKKEYLAEHFSIDGYFALCFKFDHYENGYPKMLHNDGFEGRTIPTENFTDTQDEEGFGTSKNKLYSIGAIVASILVGIVGGSKSRSVYEAVVYGFMFFIEAVISEVSSHVVTSVAIQRSGHRFALFFALMAVTCVAVAILTVH